MKEKPTKEKQTKEDYLKPVQKLVEKKEKPHEREEDYEMLVRVAGFDLPGSKNIYSGLTRIKGISWAISNAVCHYLNIPKSKKVSELSKDDLKRIETFFAEMSKIPHFLQNRRLDVESGQTAHYLGSELDIKREFDIKRMKEIRSYKGIRHAAKLPVRGQRTRSHFRNRGQTLGVKRKK